MLARLRRLAATPLGQGAIYVARLAAIGAAVVTVADRLDAYRRWQADGGQPLPLDDPSPATVAHPSNPDWEPVPFTVDLDGPTPDLVRDPALLDQLEDAATEARGDDGGDET